MVSLRSGRQLTGTAMADGQQANNEVHSQTSSSRRATRGSLTMDALQAIHDTQNEILNAIHTLTETILAQATQKPENQTRHPKPPLQSRLSPLEPPLRTIPSLDLLLRDPKQNQQPANQTQTDYVTVADVQAILRQERTRKIPPTLPDPNVLPPYPLEITKTPYPEGYTTPKFQRFDGKNGNAQEHVVRFIETLGAHGGNHTLRLREFSKSLTERAYSWVVNLPPQSVPTWEDMVAKFHAKFFQVSEKVTTLTQ